MQMLQLVGFPIELLGLLLLPYLAVRYLKVSSPALTCTSCHRNRLRCKRCSPQP